MNKIVKWSFFTRSPPEPIFWSPTPTVILESALILSFFYLISQSAIFNYAIFFVPWSWPRGKPNPLKHLLQLPHIASIQSSSLSCKSNKMLYELSVQLLEDLWSLPDLWSFRPAKFEVWSAERWGRDRSCCWLHFQMSRSQMCKHETNENGETNWLSSSWGLWVAHRPAGSWGWELNETNKWFIVCS